jgi:hypothetical protein
LSDGHFRVADSALRSSVWPGPALQQGDGPGPGGAGAYANQGAGQLGVTPGDFNGGPARVVRCEGR